MIQDILRDFILFNNADKMVGRVDEFMPPALKIITEQNRAAGMDVAMPVDMGMEPLECSWTTTGIDRGTYTGFGLMNGLRTIVTLRGAVVDPVTGIPKPVTHVCGGSITSIEPGAYKPGEKATLKATMSLIYYRFTHSIPAVPVTEIDVVNGIRVINGVDQMIALRAMIGR